MKGPVPTVRVGILDAAVSGYNSARASRWRMRRMVLIVLLLGAAGAAAGLGWWFTHRGRAPQELALYGNVDLRQVQLAFNNNERIAAVLVQEGDRVYRGQILARLDTS